MDFTFSPEQLAAIGVTRAMIPAFLFAGPGGLDRVPG